MPIETRETAEFAATASLPIKYLPYLGKVTKLPSIT